MLREKNRFEKGAHWRLSPVGCVKAMWSYATRRASKQKASSAPVPGLLKYRNETALIR